MHIGKYEQYFVDDPMGKTDTKQKEYVEKIEKANKVVQALVHEEDQRCAQEEAKKEKQKQGRKVVQYLIYEICIILACFRCTSSLPFSFLT